MTFFIVYSILTTATLIAIFYHRYFGKGKVLSQEFDKLEAEHEVLKIENAQNIKKLQEAFGGKVKMDSVDTIIGKQPKRGARGKRQRRFKRDN